jgi:hypothetical protein
MEKCIEFEKSFNVSNTEEKQDILLQKKNYYKLLLTDYKKFFKKLSFDETTTVNTNKSRTLDKTKIYNMKDTHTNLYNNIKNIKKDLYKINTTFTNILIIDGENMLKSYKYQQLMRNFLTQSTFDTYFYHWFYGGENNQPYTSLNLTVVEKMFLIKILLEHFLFNDNCIVFISGKTGDLGTVNEINDKAIIIPILYNKEDIREQDDHLMLFVYYHFSKTKECEIISGDKFKWFIHTENYLKNFKLEYNFDTLNINIVKCNAYSNDIIIYQNIIYQLGYYYFPIIQNLNDICNIDIDLNTFINIYINNLNEDKYELITNCVIKIFINLIILNRENNIDTISRYSNLITSIIKKTIKIIKPNFEEIIYILDKITTVSKKGLENDIYNLQNIIFYDIISFDYAVEITKLNQNIEKYIFMTNLYLIIKSMSFLLNTDKSIIKIAKLFSVIIRIYDKIENSIHKLRKISNTKTEINKIFLKILSHHIFMKKNGFCKKDY